MKQSIYSKDHQEAVNKVKKARLDAGLNQEEVAKILGTTQSYVSKLESGQRRLTVLQIKELARIYKKDPTYFL